MELKSFADDDFDPKKWINKAWHTSGNQEKEIFVTNTVTRLQLYMKQLTNSLDETTTQIVSSVPRVLQDATALQVEGTLLQQRLLTLGDKVNEVEERTGHSIESLHRIDNLKTTLESAASALKEADKWTALATSLEEILDSGVPTQVDKLAQLAQQVAAMTASLEVLSDSPDYDKKKIQLESLYNRLEASITAPLIEALTQMDAEKTTPYISLLQAMSRSVAARRAWRRAASARYAATWRDLDSHTLNALTRIVSNDATKQVDWLTNVLKCDTPLNELMRLYTDLILSLDPSLSKITSAKLKQRSSPTDGLNTMVDLKSDIDEFIKCITLVLEAPKTKETLQVNVLKELGRAIYAPLRDNVNQYTEMQSQVFLEHITTIKFQEDLLEVSRSLLSVSERTEMWITSGLNKGRKIAGSAIYPYYLPAVEAFMTSMSSQIFGHFRRIESAFLTASNLGQVVGVLSNTFPAALVLETATAVLLDASLVKFDDEEKSNQPLTDLPLLILDPETRDRLPSILAVVPTSTSTLRRARDQLRNLARAILRNPIDLQLDKITQLTVWNNNDALSTDLPDFALSPQEYITEIGQYLMTLPQHLELHLSEKQTPLQFLSELCTHTCDVYAEKILNIKNMDPLGTKRCITDIVYLSSVVEDLGSNVTTSLKNLEKSLRAAATVTN